MQRAGEHGYARNPNAEREIVSAETTDGGLGCLRALPSKNRLAAVELRVACDVRTHFVDAAAEFEPQKGATAAQVATARTTWPALVETARSTSGAQR